MAIDDTIIAAAITVAIGVGAVVASSIVSA